MSKMILQTVILPAPAEKLFEMYLDAELHRDFTNAPVVIDQASGSRFEAFDGQIFGTILQVIPPTLIVQKWRSVNFKPGDADSTLVLSFTSHGNNGQIDLIHLDVPDHEYDDVTSGWEQHYWQPWREYLVSTQD